MPHDLLVALALLLILEGLIPGLNPGMWRQLMQQLAQLEDRKIRLVGLGSMVAGAVMLSLLR
jgi:uncharacterized protein YjeT (DUF2065 family)